MAWQKAYTRIMMPKTPNMNPTSCKGGYIVTKSDRPMAMNRAPPVIAIARGDGIVPASGYNISPFPAWVCLNTCVFSGSCSSRIT